jgi:hypothetical protein
MKRTEETKKELTIGPIAVLVVVLVVSLFLMAGCASNPDAKSLIETLEFGPEECGEFQLTGDVNLGTSPLPGFSTKVHMNLDKRKECE